MILLQICLIPLSVLLLLGAIFVIGASGVEPPKASTRPSQDASWMDRPGSTWITDSTGLPPQSEHNHKTRMEEACGSQTTLMHSNPTGEPRSKLPIYKR